MSAGDLITNNHQYEYNGVLLGSGTVYQTETWEGLFDPLPDLINNDLSRNDDDGVVPGLDMLSGKLFSSSVNILGGATRDAFTPLMALSTAFQVRRRTEIPFCYRHPGISGVTLYINCRPRRFTITKDFDLAMGLGKLGIQLYASKPESYNRVVNSQDLSQPNATSTSTATFTVGGRRPTGPVITIGGPMPAGTIITVTGQTALDGTSDSGLQFITAFGLAAGTTMVIDMKAKTVTVGGVLKYSYKTSASNWWRLFPGSQTVTITRPAPGAAMSVTLTYQDAWLP